MRCIVVGLGIQGKKRKEIAASACVATVDPVHPEADYLSVQEVPLRSYDAALVCVPNEAKVEILHYLLSSGKHVMVEKPLVALDDAQLEALLKLAQEKGVACYTAYNHRFEPHFMRMKEVLEWGVLGPIYHCRMFYGNGTARDVRNSPWRDKGNGVLGDLGSHLLDTLFYWFDKKAYPFRVIRACNFENKSFDHVSIGSDGEIVIDLEMSLLSWRNHFTCDIVGERGSAHISSLCKWGPSTFTLRQRKLPSGRPDEESSTLVQSDPTWAAEYKHFLKCCETGESNISNDILINSILNSLCETSCR